MKLTLCLALLMLFSWTAAQAQSRSQDDQPNIEPRKTPPAQPEATPEPPPPSDNTKKADPQGESSSKDAQIQIGGGPAGPGAARSPSNPGDVSEFYPFDPHKSAKDVEVGEYYLKQKNYRAALDRFNEALLYKPKDAVATFRLAQTQEHMDLLNQSYQNYRNYLEILPSGPFAKEAKESLSKLEPHLESRNPQGASMAQMSHDIEVGETYLAQNDYDAARERFEEAVRIAPDDALANFRLAQSLQGLQRLDFARLYFRKYLQLQPEGRHAAEAKRSIADINAIFGSK
ncbi:MAG TPA: tetratricopeptide repeat protein [Candidatus Angelobacter sp.]|nr:tetratricopeptide repeat protein [Candidatus Angelobacter sp.]